MIVCIESGDMIMKKKYTKPELDTKAYAQFENVFTACNKGNAHAQGCVSDTADHSSDGNWSAAFNGNEST